MRSKSKCFLAFSILLAFFSIIYTYNFLSIGRTGDSLFIMLGRQITISYKHYGKEYIQPTNHLPLQTTSVKILVSPLSFNLNSTIDIESALFPNYGKAKLKCPLKYSIVFGKEHSESVDAIVVDAKRPEYLPQKKTKAPLLLYYDEPPIAVPLLRNGSFMRYFRYSIGYRMDSDFPNPRISEPLISYPLDFHHKYDYPAAIFSSCTSVRTKYVQELSKFSSIKAYGDCLRNVEKNNLVRRGEKNYIVSKVRLLKMHKFALTLMKFDCQDWIDERLNHAWEAGTLPLFLGTDSVRQILPKYLHTSILSISDFKKPVNLAEHLNVLINNQYEYDVYMNWRYQNRDSNDKSPLMKVWKPMYSPGCQIALRLNRDRVSGDQNRTLKPIMCEERAIDMWLGKAPKLPKIVDD